MVLQERYVQLVLTVQLVPLQTFSVQTGHTPTIYELPSATLAMQGSLVPIKIEQTPALWDITAPRAQVLMSRLALLVPLDPQRVCHSYRNVPIVLVENILTGQSAETGDCTAEYYCQTGWFLFIIFSGN